jgi:hypothetical protein
MKRRKDFFPLGAGRCRSCPRCAIRDGKPCPNPNERINSIDGIGINIVSLLSKKLGVPINWIRCFDDLVIFPRTMTYVIGILGHRSFENELSEFSEARLRAGGFETMGDEIVPVPVGKIARIVKM